jgi:transcriptional regulator with XRE-family HTH domain
LVARRPKADLMAIGSRIRAIRGEVLQEELAAFLHIRQGQLSKIERGKSAPSIDVLLLLSERFHRAIDWILKGEGG